MKKENLCELLIKVSRDNFVIEVDKCHCCGKIGRVKKVFGLPICMDCMEFYEEARYAIGELTKGRM